MANWSDIDITITGNHKQISLFIMYINKYIEDDYLSYDGRSMIINSITLDTNNLSNCIAYIQGEGRWAGPSHFFANAAELFKLTIDYKERESGCGFVVHLTGSDGHTLYEEDTYYSQLYIDMYGLDEFIEDISRN